MYYDAEINALSNVYEALKGFDNAQIKRILDWITSKLELDLKSGQSEADGSPKPAPVDALKPGAAPVNKSHGRKPGHVRHMIEEAQPHTIASGIKDFMKYHSFEEIFNESTTRSAGAKMLLAAAYLQVKENFKELSCYDISSRLKKIGEEVNHPSVAINFLVSQKPPLLLQTAKKTGIKSRRKFKVTEEGLRIASNYIND